MKLKVYGRKGVKSEMKNRENQKFSTSVIDA